MFINHNFENNRCFTKKNTFHINGYVKDSHGRGLYFYRQKYRHTWLSCNFNRWGSVHNFSFQKGLFIPVFATFLIAALLLWFIAWWYITYIGYIIPSRYGKDILSISFYILHSFFSYFWKVLWLGFSNLGYLADDK